MRIHTKCQVISWSAFTRPGEDGRFRLLCTVGRWVLSIARRTRSKAPFYVHAQQRLTRRIVSSFLAILGPVRSWRGSWGG
jgi:hypothetical protein